MNPLYDSNFLKKLSLFKNKETFIRLTSFKFNKLPQQTILGKVTGGNINIDGSSTVRRTCNLTLVSDNKNINDYYWTFKTRFLVEIGVKNTIDNKYPEIIWFSQGYYYISTFSISRGLDSNTINISGKDKMSFLNGEFGGTINSQIDLAFLETKEIFFAEKKLNPEQFLQKCEAITVENSEKLDNKYAYYKLDVIYTKIEKLSREEFEKETNVYAIYNKSKDEYNIMTLYDKNKEYYQVKINFNESNEPIRPIKKINKPTLLYRQNNIYNDKENSIEDTYLYPEEKNYFIKEENEKRIKIPIKEIIMNLVYQYGKEPYSNIIINDLPEYGKELLTYIWKNPMYLFYDKVNNKYYRLREKDSIRLPHINSEECPEDFFVEYPQIHLEDNPEQEFKTMTLYIKKQGVYKISEKYDSEMIYYYNYGKNNKDKNRKYNIDQRYLPTNAYDMLYGSFYEDWAQEFRLYLNDEKTTDQNGKIVKGVVIRIQDGDTAGYRITDLVYPGELILSAGATVVSGLEKIKQVLGNYEFFYDLNERFIFQEKKNYLNTSFSNLIETEENEFSYDSYNNKYSFIFDSDEMQISESFAPNLSNIKNDFTVLGNRKESKLFFHARYAIDKKPYLYKSIEGRVFYSKDCPDELRPAAESYKVDWRELIYQMALDYRRYGTLDYLDTSKNNIDEVEEYPYLMRENNPHMCDEFGMTGYEQYYIDLQGFWRTLYNPFFEFEKDLNLGFKEDDYFLKEGLKYRFWTKKLRNSETLSFWFDFLDTSGEIEQFSVKNIGSREMVKNSSNIKAIKYQEPLPITYVKSYSEDSERQEAVSIIQVVDMDQRFTNSSQTLDALSEIDNLIYQNALMKNSVTINSIPIYFLEPNTLIQIKGQDLQLQGDYILNKISYNLSYDGTMQLTLIKNQNYII